MDPNQQAFLQMLNQLNQANGVDFSQVRVDPNDVAEIQRNAMNFLRSICSFLASIGTILKHIDEKALHCTRRIIMMSDQITLIFMTILSIIMAFYIKQLFWFLVAQPASFWILVSVIYLVISRITSGKNYYKIIFDFFIKTVELTAYIFQGLAE